jgi:ribonuclease VapC
MVVDASAMVAILLHEPEADSLLALLPQAPRRITHGVSVWEASRAVARVTGWDVARSHDAVQALLAVADIELVAIGEPESFQAVAAHMRYGKGTGHPAQLNLGDCFTYGTAQTRGMRILFKGEDFSHTPRGIGALTPELPETPADPSRVRRRERRRGR